jgi:hypothetical protein
MVLKDFHPWRVYVTFAKQADQRKCLKRTAVSYFAIMSGSAPGSEANFQGCLLNIDRAPEPSDIVYDNSHYTFFGRWIRTVLSYFICSIVLVLVFVIIKAMGSSSAGVIAAFISGVNVVLPQFVRITTWYIERHVKKSDEQTSVLIKLAVVRCVNSGVLIYLSAPSLQQFSAEHLNHVQNILIADSITTPLLRVLDIPGLISRHYSSKGVATQDELNVLFTPAEWSLAERYTDMLKTLFVGFFFAVPVPSGLIITCFAMFTTYFVDKYSRMRQWKRNTGLDESLSTVARYVLLLIVFAHVAVSKGYFANWPFAEAATIVDCQFLTCSIGPFMSSEQKALVKLYNILNIILFVIVIIWFVFVNFGGWILSLFVDGSNINVNERDEDDTKTTYRDPNAKFPAYIPIIEPQAYPDPIIMADVSKLPKQYMPLTRSELFNLDKLDPAQLSVVRTEELPTVSDERVLKSLFSSVCYYEPLGKAFTPYVKPVFQAAGGISAVGSPILVDGFGRTARGTTVSVPAPTSLDLPVGWVEKKDATGKVYYSNSITKVTSWNRPTN